MFILTNGSADNRPDIANPDIPFGKLGPRLRQTDGSGIYLVPTGSKTAHVNQALAAASNPGKVFKPR
jgi:hypothetical protein